MSEVESKRKPRALKGKDLYLMTAIIGKIGVRNIARCMNAVEVREAAKENEGKTEDERADIIGELIFYGLVDVLFERLDKCEGTITKLLARLYDMPESEVEELDANDYLDMFIDMVKGENFADFFRRAYESAKRVM